MEQKNRLFDFLYQSLKKQIEKQKKKEYNGIINRIVRKEDGKCIIS